MHKNLKTFQLADFLKVVWKRRYAFFSIIFGVTLSAIIYSFTLPNIYHSEAVVLPASSSNPSAGVASLLSNVASLGGFGGGSNDSVKSYMLFINSDIFREHVVQSQELVSYFFPGSKRNDLADPEKVQAVAKQLKGIVVTKNDPKFSEKLIISAESENPTLTTEVVRQYLVELQNFMSRNTLTQAKRYRQFLEGQLAKNKEELLEMGKGLSEFYQRNSVSAVQSTLNVPVAMKTNEGPREFKNYDEFKVYFNVLQKSEEVDGKKEEVQYVQNVPQQIYLRYLTTQQQILEGNYAMLSQAYEHAKMEEAKQDPTFVVLDEPVVPIVPIRPNRKSIALGAFAISLVISLLYVLFKEFYQEIPFLNVVRTHPSEMEEAKVVY